MESNSSNQPKAGLAGCTLSLGQLSAERAFEQESLHTVISLCADLYWQENADGICTGVSSYSDNTTDAAHNLIGRRLSEIGQASAREQAALHWQQYLDCIRQRKAFRQLYCTIKNSYLQISGVPQYNNNAEFLGYECLATDMTRARNHEISLERFRAAMDMSMDMIYLVDKESLTFIDVNDTACRNARLSREQVLSTGPARLLGLSHAELTRRYDKLISAGQSSRTEHQLLSADGKPVIVEVHSRATQFNGRWVIIGISRDISARKKAESQALRLQQLFSALSLANEAILRADSITTLYQQACTAAISSRLFVIASVLVPDSNGHFKAIASSGDQSALDAFASLDIPKRKTRINTQGSDDTCMAVQATRDGKAVFANDFKTGGGTGEWRAKAEEHGIHSAAALPLFLHKTPIAVILFCASARHAFDAQTQSILQSIADNMSFALDSFANAAEQAQAAELIRSNEERFRSLTSLSSDFYWEMDIGHRFVLYEGRVIGASNRDAIDKIIGHALWEGDGITPDSMDWKQFRRLLRKEQAFKDFEFSFRNRDGKVYHLALSGVPRLDQYGRFNGYRGITHDITSKKRIANHIKHLATHDTLTGLPNRMMFSQLLEQAIRNANRYKEQRFAVLFIDLDRFKTVNDTYGHHTGDLLLAEVAKRLKIPLRNSDIVARLGGDEFVVLLQKVYDKDHASRIAANLLKMFNRPITLEHREFLISASIGISLYGVDASNEETLMTHADTAMYTAKEEGRNNYRLYSADLHQHRQLRAELSVALRHALKRGELSLNYQAKMDLASGRIMGVEALLRWHHPQYGEISPSQFIPIAEDNGLIVPIGEWVMASACRQVLDWQKKGLPALQLAVNLSTRQFNHPELPTYIQQLLDDIGFPAEQLELEITESLVVQNPERAIRLMQEMKRTGIRFALDDFGTGYSSLGQLRHYPIDTLKIDRVFIRDLVASREDQAISKAIISMSKTLGLTVVAEGVENARQVTLLRQYHCDQIQGYFCHRPVNAEQFTAWFQQQHNQQHNQPGLGITLE